MTEIGFRAYASCMHRVVLGIGGQLEVPTDLLPELSEASRGSRKSYNGALSGCKFA